MNAGLRIVQWVVLVSAAGLIGVWPLTLRAVESSASAPASTATATSPSTTGDDRGKDKATEAGELEKPAVTTHSCTLADGRTLDYEVTAARMIMKSEDDDAEASIFFVAYRRTGGDDEAAVDRALTFVFNGGPGAAAVWLHMGVAGPVRVALGTDGMPPAPPYEHEPNPETWLSTTDLVFVDPVGTGFSRMGENAEPKEFYGVKQDIRWVAEFIRLYITRYRRWPSPKFIAGESYGATRAAGLAEHLLDRHGIALSGLILISPALEFQALRPGPGNDLPYPLYLPTYTATAWYHRRLDDRLQENLEATLEEVQDWALGSYLPALVVGDALDPQQRREIIERLSMYTSLPEEVIVDSDLRVSPWLFCKELLKDQRQLVGRFDSRVTGYEPEPTAGWPTFDPSLSGYLPVYSSTFNDYVRRELEYESMLSYEVLSPRVHPWDFGKDGHGYLSMTQELRLAIVKNPHLRVFLASGYYDLATPFFATDHAVRGLQLSSELRAGIRQSYYQGGHMMYHNLTALRKLADDVARFVEDAAASTE